MVENAIFCEILGRKYRMRAANDFDRFIKKK